MSTILRRRVSISGRGGGVMSVPYQVDRAGRRCRLIGIDSYVDPMKAEGSLGLAWEAPDIRDKWKIAFERLFLIWETTMAQFVIYHWKRKTTKLVNQIQEAPFFLNTPATDAVVETGPGAREGEVVKKNYLVIKLPTGWQFVSNSNNFLEFLGFTKLLAFKDPRGSTTRGFANASGEQVVYKSAPFNPDHSLFRHYIERNISALDRAASEWIAFEKAYKLYPENDGVPDEDLLKKVLTAEEREAPEDAVGETAWEIFLESALGGPRSPDEEATTPLQRRYHLNKILLSAEKEYTRFVRENRVVYVRIGPVRHLTSGEEKTYQTDDWPAIVATLESELVDLQNRTGVSPDVLKIAGDPSRRISITNTSTTWRARLRFPPSARKIFHEFDDRPSDSGPPILVLMPGQSGSLTVIDYASYKLDKFYPIQIVSHSHHVVDDQSQPLLATRLGKEAARNIFCTLIGPHAIFSYNLILQPDRGVMRLQMFDRDDRPLPYKHNLKVLLHFQISE